MYDLPEDAICYANSAHGVYIPQHFAESIKRECVRGVTQEQWVILEQGPDHESYCCVWGEVIDHAIVTDFCGFEYCLHQDGDLWLVPIDWQPFEE